jgi:hypothetical protein
MAEFTRREVTQRRVEYRLRSDVPCGELVKAIHVARREVETLYPERAGYDDAVTVTVDDDEIVLFFNCETMSTGS